jgi:predicted NAD/FAD-binding protein
MEVTMAQLQKIAVLGGGAGSLAAAFYLSAQPGWQERYDITVYQQGWRLGGKAPADAMPRWPSASKNTACTSGSASM